MEQSLFRILYCSQNVIGNVDPDTEISQILQKSRTNNSSREVTGALLYSSGYFAQVLEGPRPSIEETFERIQRDPRHRDVAVLECSPIDHRDFPEWSMARVQPLSESQSAVAASALHQAMDHADGSGDKVLDLLRTLVVQNE